MDIKESTRDGYAAIYQRYIYSVWAYRKVSQITPAEIQNWVVTLTGSRGKPVGASSKRQAHQVLAMVLDSAVRAGGMSRNPARWDAIGKVAYLPPLRVQSDHQYLTADELRTVARECGRYEALILLMGTTGLRWGEATALTVGDIDFLRRRVRVVKAHVQGAKGQVRVDTPKTHQSRNVPLMPLLLEHLSVTAKGKDRDSLLFTASNDSPLRNNNFHRNVWSKARAKAGHPDLRIHDLRHTAASLAVAAGANVKAVQQMLGHSSAQMTLDHYAGLFDGHLDDVADRMQTQFQTAKSDSDVTGGGMQRSFKVAGMSDSVAETRASAVAPGRIELPTQGLGNLPDDEETEPPPHK
jgi:hypothetical protein